MPTVTFTGLASGLDTQAMIQAILEAARKPIEKLQVRQDLFSQRRSAFDELRSKLDAFEGAVRALKSSSTFRGRTTSVSDAAVLRATAGAGAEVGLFEVEVQQLAAAHKVKSNGLASADQGLVSDGTITLQSGTKDPIIINVSAANGNNTLAAVRDAINAADAGVRASIVYDGSAHRLTVRSAESGTANALTLDDTTNLDLDEAANLVTAASDALLRVDGIDVTASSNRVTGVIPGVTLDLTRTTAGAPITVEVAQDTQSVAGAVQSLVEQYNSLVEFFNLHNSRENPGVLAGDTTLRGVQNQLQNLFVAGVPGIPLGQIRSLSALGVSFDGRTGEASLNTARLQELLSTNFNEVGNVFLSSGSTSDPRIRFIGSTSSTLDGAYSVEITQAAEQATLVGSNAISSLKKDETLTITVGSESVAVFLPKNSTLTDVISLINQGLTGAGIAAYASDDGGRLRLSTTAYGSKAQITVVTDVDNPGNGKQTGFETTPASDSGQNVAGRIGGVDAVGDGFLLTAADGGPHAGLLIQANVSAADIAATGGAFGSVSYSRGLVDSLIRKVDDITRFRTGVLDLTRNNLDKDIDRLSRDIERIEDRIRSKEARLIQMFSAAERAISSLQAQQSRLG